MWTELILIKAVAKQMLSPYRRRPIISTTDVLINNQIHAMPIFTFAADH